MRQAAEAVKIPHTMDSSTRFDFHSRTQSGFTLIEMTVVVAIIAVIASMVLPSVRGLIFQGRGTGKAADLREMTTAAARHLEEYRTPPTASGSWPPVEVRDVDGDGTIRIALDTANPDGANSLPGNIDAFCTTASTSLADAIDRCLLSIDFNEVDKYVQNFPKHAGEDATADNGSTATYDDDQSTPDLTATSVDVAGHNLEIYVKDAGSPSGTPFPAGALKVWNITNSGNVWAIKSDNIYGVH